MTDPMESSRNNWRAIAILELLLTAVLTLTYAMVRWGWWR